MIVFHHFVPYADEFLSNSIDKSADYVNYEPFGHFKGKVSNFSREDERNVDIINRTCECLEFQENLIPCRHAAAAIMACGKAIHNFVDTRYYVSKYRNLKNIPFIPMNVGRLTKDSLKPPSNFPRRKGRPRLLDRHPSIIERGNRTSRVKCSACGNFGHTRRAARCPLRQPEQ